VSATVVSIVVATCVKFVHPTPWHRSTRYPVTAATLSVEAVQERSISEALAAVTNGSTPTTAACHVAGELMENVALYVPGAAARPVSAPRKFEDADTWGV
jgi:hypothetical protein